MKKIVFLHVSSILGGSERSFLDLIEKATPEQRRQFHVLVPNEGPLWVEIKKRAPETSVRSLPFPSLFQKGSRKFPLMTFFLTVLSLPSLFIYLFRLRKILQEIKPDLLYTNGIKCHLVGLIQKKGLGIPLVWHMQDYFPKLTYVDFFLRLVRTEPDLIICNSESVQTEIHQVLPQKWNTQLQTVHNAVDLQQFRPALRASNPIPIISMVGMLTPWKGQDVFIDAIDYLTRTDPELEFQAQIVGGEAYNTQGESGFQKKLSEKVQERQLSKKILFRGMIEDIEEIYRSSDIVTHCSKKPEPFGRVIIEAMASGCSVIATRGGGVNEIIQDGQNGFLVNPSSPEELANALRNLIVNPHLRKSFSEAGRKTVEQNFSATTFSKNILTSLDKADSC